MAQETGVLYENTVNMIYTVCVQIMDFFVKVRIKSSSGLNMKTLAQLQYHEHIDTSVLQFEICVQPEEF